jgi:lambda family phage portal protein
MNKHGRYTSAGYASATNLANIDGLSFTRDISGDGAIDLSREGTVAVSRRLMRNNPIYRGVLGRCVSYVVGNGFGLQALTEDTKWNTEAERLWNEFWASPCVSNTLSGSRLESLVFLEMLTTGDIFELFVKDAGEIRLQLFEAEQCVTRTGKTTNGILRDDLGRPKQYMFAPYGVNGYVTRSKATPYEAQHVIHLFDHERPSASRGMPALQASFSMLHRINDICDAEAIARQMLAHLAMTVTRGEAPAAAYGESTADTSDNRFRIQELDYATIFHARPGESISSVDRNIPGGDFEKSMIVFLRMLGLPLGMPLELVMLDWTKSNYSQSRAVMQQAYQTFLHWQNILKTRSMSRIYKRKVEEWVKGGRLSANAQAFKHEWIAPTFPWIDEAKELEAQGKKIELSLSSHSEICKALQHDRDTIVAARETEIRDAITRAKNIKEQTGVDVPYQLFCGLPIQNAAVVSKTNEGESKEDKAEPIDDKDNDKDKEESNDE